MVCRSAIIQLIKFKSVKNMRKLMLNWKTYGNYILPLGVLMITCAFAIGASPLFKTNPWDDSNAMLTMGRSVIHGLVPYKDLVEQRGPFLFLLYAVAAFLKSTSFLGVFIIEIINIMFIYILSLKISRDFKPAIISERWLALAGPFALLATNAFTLGGAPEEFAFTSILYLVYVVNHYRQHIAEVPLKVYFILGLNLSFVFWNKYSMIGAFVVFFAWVAIDEVIRKRYKKLVRIIFASIFGFLSISLVFIIYFWLNDALGDLFKIYFFQNIEAYGKTDQSAFMKFWTALSLIALELRIHLVVLSTIFLGYISAIYKNKQIILELLMFFGAIIFVALQHSIIDYYNIIWMPFFAVSLIRLVSNIRTPRSHSLNVGMPIIVCFVMIFMPIINNGNLNRLVLKGSDHSLDGHQVTAQVQLADDMLKLSKSHQPKLMMINSLDKGFFLATRTVPHTMYWHRLNMNYEQLPQMYASFEKSMTERKVDFVIVSLNSEPDSDVTKRHVQIADAVDSHLREPLFKNYRVQSIASDRGDEYYVLMARKN